MTIGPERRRMLARESRRLCATLGASAAREVLLAAVTTRVARTAMTDGELRATAPILLRMGLSGTRSPKRFVSRPDRGKGGFSNRFATRHPQRHPEARWLVYLARDRRAAAAAQHAEDQQTSSEFAATLRYPECCTTFYRLRWSRAERCHQGDLFPFSDAATPPGVAGHALLNFGANYFGGGWTSFFPCSLTCPNAIQLLRSDRRHVRSIDPRLAEEADEQASRPIVYTEYRGIAQLGTWSVSGDDAVIQYDPASVTLTVAPSAGPLWRALSMADGIRPAGRRGVDLMRGRTLVHRHRAPDVFVRWFSDY